MSSPESSQPQPTPEARKLTSYPTVEDWQEIQGGKPTLWLNAENNNLRVVHIYEDAMGEFSGSGKVVDTPLQEPLSIIDNRPRLDESMTKLVRIKVGDGRYVDFPIFMLYEFHGAPCETRSRELKAKSLPGEEQYSVHDVPASDFDGYKQIMLEKGFSQIHLLPNAKGTYIWLS